MQDRVANKQKHHLIRKFAEYTMHSRQNAIWVAVAAAFLPFFYLAERGGFVLSDVT